MRTRTRGRNAHAGMIARCSRRRSIADDLERSAIPLDADSLLAAARGLAAATMAVLATFLALALILGWPDLAALSAFLLVAVPILSRETVLSYPKAVASKRALLIARSSTDDVSLMVMNLRHEPSLPKAMATAAKRGSEFGSELRECVWRVITGVHSTFEDSLGQLAVRWQDHCAELKPAIRALITASCEGTEAGRRRALDRANEALVAGAKRRIEEFTLALSVPSMILFGIGILLPLIMGAFLPMLSWDMFADDDGISTGGTGTKGMIVPTIILMNLVFPTIALLVALDAISKHPMASQCTRDRGETRPVGSRIGILVAITSSTLGVTAAIVFLDGKAEYVLGFLAASIPVGALLIIHGSGAAVSDDRGRREQLEDLLFNAGARMVDGENLEAAMQAASADIKAESLPDAMRWDGAGESRRPGNELNEESALAVVVAAADKDETQAGILAMDLAGYARDIAELEAVLRRRLKPTLSMMRMTTHALAPVMLGVTHAIYMSLASIEGGAGGLSPGTLFVVLAAFLVEINAIVAYFAWGVGDRQRSSSLAYSVGTCIVTAVLVMSAVVMVAT
ncbi:MAG: hypothetical protein JSU93_05130 [Methanobacteriota archaeon]|nr:MAG: hypothetical protein JSU93_05130 [Euryarchaeota archaeon]